MSRTFRMSKDRFGRCFLTWPTAQSCSAPLRLPIGTVGKLERAWNDTASGRTVSFACSPENLRLGKAIEVFTKPDRVVVGVRDEHARASVAALLAPITDRIEWMSVESAEMTKHAVNSFLATSVTFINELAALCERTGADAKEVERGLKTERRIGPQAYLSPGGAFAGGTLARDVAFLRTLGTSVGRPTPLMDGVVASNAAHRDVGPALARVGPWQPGWNEDRGLGPYLQARHRHASTIRLRRTVSLAREPGRLGPCSRPGRDGDT